MEGILASILAPLAKILIRNNFLLPPAIETVKRCLVQAAIEDGASTDSLISLRTGVHRKDVKRLRMMIDEGSNENYPIKGLAMVLSVWTNSDRFRDATGDPQRLYRVGEDGFDALVRASKIDLAPATVLQELTAQNLIAQDEDGGIELISTTFVAQSGEAALKAFEATIIDHIDVATRNVLSDPGMPRHFDQVVRYSHLSEASVKKLEAEARREARKYLENLNAMAHRLQSEDDASGELSGGRFVAGAFVAPYVEADEDDGATASEKDHD
ncbi:MAG: DUF6502 family protein [Pseudomonadota bacterium]